VKVTGYGLENIHPDPGRNATSERFCSKLSLPTLSTRLRVTEERYWPFTCIPWRY